MLMMASVSMSCASPAGIWVRDSASEKTLLLAMQEAGQRVQAQARLEYEVI